MPRTSSIFSAADDLVIVQCWHAGMSVAQIARMMDRPYATTRYRITQLVQSLHLLRRYYWPGRAKKSPDA